MKTNNFTSRLLIAVAIFLATVFAIVVGFLLLRRYYSRAFVLNASIKNLKEERLNSSRSKEVFLQNEKSIEVLKSHEVKNRDEIPLLVEALESYALDLEISLDVKTINLDETKKVAKVLQPTDSLPDSKTAPAEAAKKESGKNLTIEISSDGDFDKLLKLLQLFENGDYVLAMDSYSLRQVVVLESTRPGGEPIYRDVRSNDDTDADAIKTWALDAKLIVPTNIK